MRHSQSKDQLLFDLSPQFSCSLQMLNGLHRWELQSDDGIPKAPYIIPGL